MVSGVNDACIYNNLNETAVTVQEVFCLPDKKINLSGAVRVII